MRTLQRAVWAMEPEALKQFAAYVSGQAAGKAGKGDVSGREAFFCFGGDPDEDEPPYRVERGVAFVPLRGTITPRRSFMNHFGALNNFCERVQLALDDESVGALVLEIDSPGGVASGLEAAWAMVTRADEVKPTFAWTPDIMASAAYWIGCGARKVFSVGTAWVGSIGVRLLHADWSGFNERLGVTFTHIVQGRDKAIGNEDEPLTVEALNYFETLIKPDYRAFVRRVAASRGLDPSTAETTWASGRVFTAAQALELGLIDGVVTRDELLETILTEVNSVKDVKELEAAYPGLVGEVRAEARGDVVAAVEAAEAKGALAGRAEGHREVLEVVGAAFGDDSAKGVEAYLQAKGPAAQAKALTSLGRAGAAPDPNTRAAQEIVGALGDGGNGPVAGGQNKTMTDAQAVAAASDRMLAHIGVTPGA